MIQDSTGDVEAVASKRSKPGMKRTWEVEPDRDADIRSRWRTTGDEEGDRGAEEKKKGHGLGDQEGRRTKARRWRRKVSPLGEYLCLQVNAK